MDWPKKFEDLFGYKLSHRSSSAVASKYQEHETKLSGKREMSMQNEDRFISGRADEVIESTKPRVRLPVVTKGIINPVAITQLQDELEDTKKELDRLRATRVFSKDEIILPKRMSLPTLMEAYPAVGEQIVAKMDKKLRDAREEYEAIIKETQDKHRDKYSRCMADSREMEAKIYKADEKFRRLEEMAKTHPNAPIGDVWTRIQEGTYDHSKRPLSERKDINKIVSSTESRTSRTTTPDLLASTNPFRNNRWANSDSRKREYNESAEPEFGKDVKRLKKE